MHSSRKERVAQLLKKFTETALQNNAETVRGIHASEVADELGLERTSASRELNALYSEGMAIKFLGKPTRYLHYFAVQDFIGDEYLPTTIPAGKSLADYLPKEDVNSFGSHPGTSFNPPSLLNSYESSLRHAAALAEAAIRYPSHDLHLLITGPHGAGKASFTDRIFAFGVNCGKFPPKAKKYIFSCHSTIGSANALAVRLFGAADGLNGPASPSKKGLVEIAADGVLVLEEAQFLPPAIQDRFLTLMTRHTFSRVGEGDVNRHSRVMLIATCSEEPIPYDSCPLLRYFPTHIALPALSTRSTTELFYYICQLFQVEAKALNREVHVSKDVMYILLCASSFANLANLQGRVKSICSLAYSKQGLLSTRSGIHVSYEHIPQDFFSNIKYPSVSEFSLFLNRHFNGDVIICPNALPSLPQTTEPSFPVENNASPDYTVFHSVRCSFEALLRATYNSRNGSLEKYASTAFHVSQHLRTCPALQQLTTDDPIVYVLAQLVTPERNEEPPWPQISPEDSVDLQKTIPPDFIRLGTVLSEMLNGPQNALVRENAPMILALYLQVIQDWLESTHVLIFTVYRGPGVSEGLATLLSQRYSYPVIPLSCPVDGDLPQILSKLDEALAAAPAKYQALFFTDGIPFTALHTYVERTYGHPATSFFGTTFDFMENCVQKISNYHFSLSMLDEAAPSALPAENKPISNLTPFVSRAIQESLLPDLAFVDITKCIPLLSESLEQISIALQHPVSDDSAVKYYVHCAHMIERLIRKEPLAFPNLKPFTKNFTREIHIIEAALRPISQFYGIRIPTAEIAYLVEIFQA